MLHHVRRALVAWTAFDTSLTPVLTKPLALTLTLALTSSPSLPSGAQNLLSQKSGLIKGNTTFMTGNIQKMAEVSLTEPEPEPGPLSLSLTPA